MKFHRPSFLHYLTTLLPERLFSIYAHRWTLHVIPPNRYFTWRLMHEYLTEAVVTSCAAPLDAPDGPRQRSLFDAPPAAHLDALRVALSERSDYAEIHHITTLIGERVEFRIDLKAIQSLVSQVRREQDVNLSIVLMQGEVFMSERLLNLKMRRLYGREISNRRCRQVMAELVTRGLCKNNGNLRTAGREVLI